MATTIWAFWDIMWTSYPKHYQDILLPFSDLYEFPHM